MSDTRSCDCSCHVGPYTACDIPGGCGSTGCGHNRKRGSCVTCAVYRPDADARDPNRPPVCDGDRRLLDSHLAEVANLVATLRNDEPALFDKRRYERFIIKKGQPVSLGETWSDPLAAVGGVAPINSRSNAPAVSGSRERPIPIPVTALDLQAPARLDRPSEAAMRWPDDQVGYLSAATVLASWTHDVRDTVYPDHHLPPATVDELVSWLRHRVDDICDQHPAVADLAEEIRNLRGALRSAAGETEPQPERCDGVPCRRCDQMSLYRQPGGDVTCINPDCQTVLRDVEYVDWVKALAAEQKIKRHAGQNV